MDSIFILVLIGVASVQFGTNFADDEEDYQRTVIFVQKFTNFGQDLFLRGGIDHDVRNNCTNDATTSDCAIPIKHRLGDKTEKFSAWKTGENYLDWYGAEAGQGSFGDTQASGTPMVWTTNDATNPATVGDSGYGYTNLNVWGDHYWMVDLDMDCNVTEDGWFELKSFLPGVGWENDINQDESCHGDAGENKTYSSGNHMGRCGLLNMFTSNGNGCYISNLD